LAILAIFVKQRTYLATLTKQRTYLAILLDISVRRRFAQGT
jgi:hypothetical protein